MKHKVILQSHTAVMTKGIPEPKNDRQGFSVIKIKAVFDVMFALMYINLLTGLQTATKMVANATKKSSDHCVCVHMRFCQI